VKEKKVGVDCMDGMAPGILQKWGGEWIDCYTILHLAFFTRRTGCMVMNPVRVYSNEYLDRPTLDKIIGGGVDGG
jgi:hypothetical protein